MVTVTPNEVRVYVDNVTVEAPTEKQALDLYLKMTCRKATTYIVLELNEDGIPSGAAYKVTNHA